MSSSANDVNFPIIRNHGFYCVLFGRDFVFLSAQRVAAINLWYQQAAFDDDDDNNDKSDNNN